jgi:hypothetical protein
VELSFDREVSRPIELLKTVPQRLKPSRDQGIYGTAQAVPFV